MPESLLPGVDVGTLLIRREAFERVGPYQDRWNVGEFIDWYGRAVDAGLGLSLLPERVGWRRVHLCNSSRIGAQRSGYARALKPLLDRHSLASGPQI